MYKGLRGAVVGVICQSLNDLSKAEDFAGVINTIHEYYPDAKYVEYYSPGINEHLFQSLRFIYQEKAGEWYLIGIARDVATV